MARSIKRVRWACSRYSFNYGFSATMVLGSNPSRGIAANCIYWMRGRPWRSPWGETARSRAQYAGNPCPPSIAAPCSIAIPRIAGMCCALNALSRARLVATTRYPANARYASPCGICPPKHIISWTHHMKIPTFERMDGLRRWKS